MAALQPRPRGARRKSLTQLRRETGSELSPVATGYVESFDGTRIFYSIEGRGQPLVFCYGLVCSSLHWTYQIDHFQGTHQAIWFDYRGHQNSEAPKDFSTLTLETMVRDLECVLNELGVEKPVLLGHSMGVNVVLEFYRRNPERVRGMVLANGTPKRPLETLFSTNALEGAFSMLSKLYQKSPNLVRSLWKFGKNNPLARTIVQLGGFNPHLTPSEDVQLYVNQVTDMDPGILLHLIENYGSCDATSWLHTVRAPTLIIAGQEDKVIPLEQQELMHQLIPGSELEIIRHGSHCPQMDLPEQVNLIIEAFLKKTEAL